MASRETKENLLIINRRTGKALQSTGLDDGMVVEQAAITGGDAQLWTPVKVGKNVKLRNKQSGKVLDVMHGGTEAGTWAQTWKDVDGDSQLWQLVRVTATYKKLMNVQSGKMLDIVDMRDDDGAPAQIWDDVDGVGQQWKLAEPQAVIKAGAKPAPKKRAPRKAKAEAAPAEAEKAPAKKRGRKPKAEAQAE